MSGKNIIDLRRGRSGDAEDFAEISRAGAGASDVLDLADLDESGIEDMEKEEDLPLFDTPGSRLVAALTAVLLIAWTGFFAWTVTSRGTPLDAAQLPGLIRDYAVPVIAIVFLHLLLSRNSRAQSRRYAGTAAALRTEGRLLEARMKRLATDLAAARSEVAEQALAIEQMSSGSTQRLKMIAETLSHSATAFDRSAGQAQQAGDTLVAKLTGLDDAMPGLEDRAHRLHETLQEGAMALDDRLEALEARLVAINDHTGQARSQINAAAKSLTAQLNQLTEASRGAEQSLEGMAEIAVNRLDLAGERAEQVLGQSKDALEAQAAALEALVDQSRTAIGLSGKDAIAAFEAHAMRVRDWLNELTSLTEQHNAASADLDASMAALVDKGIAGNARLVEATARLSGDLEGMAATLGIGNQEAEALIERSERLVSGLRADLRELDVAVPQAMDRVEARVSQSRNALSDAAPDIERLETSATEMLARVREAAEHLARHQASIEALIGGTQAGLAATGTRSAALQAELSAAERAMHGIADSAAPQLVEALNRVQETAERASDKAREALARGIAKAAAQLGDASARVLEETVGTKVAAQLDAIALAARGASSAADASTRDLESKLTALQRAVSDMEQRAREAEEKLEASDRESLSRRSALLIESLNSTAIDVAKLMSGEVSDTAWNAYLRGDRGAFTRKAVRLIDNREARRIAALYQHDPDFAEHVNRYVHDFEAMLRNILAVREGSALGVTLLSSDLGKLYVALAQGIERLRN